MTRASAGDRLIIDSERAGQPNREGVIVEVLEGFGGTHYRVRWDDGHESTYFPGGGDSCQVVAAPERAAQP
jgi:Domain of unknown function (DUF1918)